MYLRCPTCEWSQDDYWDDHYNPITCVTDWLDDLLHRDLDEMIPADGPHTPAVSVRELLARAFEHEAAAIRQMKYWTREDAKANEFRCPVCGGFCLED